MPATSEYERLRQQNIEERLAKFHDVFTEVKSIAKEFTSEFTLSTQHPKARKSRRPAKTYNKLVGPITRSSPPRTRLRSGNISHKRLRGDADDDEDEIKEVKPSLKHKKVRRQLHYHFNLTERVILEPEDVTERMLSTIAQSTANKIYDHAKGTCCHQCRQKTLDQKTVCRGKDCFGVRGQFCGPCLRNRYGEDVSVALKNPDWECPPCRDICNCSFCRAKKGRFCTGIMIHTAKKEGYTNVRDFLKSAKESEDEIEVDEPDDDDMVEE